MSLEYPDIVENTPVTLSETYNEPTEGTAYQTRAYVEEDSKLRFGPDGAPIEPTITILYPRGTTINKGDYVQIIKLHGQTPTTHEAIRRTAQMVSRVGGSRVSHIEVLVGAKGGF